MTLTFLLLSPAMISRNVFPFLACQAIAEASSPLPSAVGCHSIWKFLSNCVLHCSQMFTGHASLTCLRSVLLSQTLKCSENHKPPQPCVFQSATLPYASMQQHIASSQSFCGACVSNRTAQSVNLVWKILCFVFLKRESHRRSYSILFYP